MTTPMSDAELIKMCRDAVVMLVENSRAMGVTGPVDDVVRDSPLELIATRLETRNAELEQAREFIQYIKDVQCNFPEWWFEEVENVDGTTYIPSEVADDFLTKTEGEKSET